jgi:hypothetical protein
MTNGQIMTVLMRNFSCSVNMLSMSTFEFKTILYKHQLSVIIADIYRLLRQRKQKIASLVNALTDDLELRFIDLFPYI